MQTRHRIHGPDLTNAERNNVFGHGWVRGYDRIFSEAFGIRFNSGPVRIDALQDLVLTRKSIQHEVSITEVRPTHADRKPGSSRSFFLDDSEVEMLDRLDPDAKTWLEPPSIHVDQAKLDTALNDVSQFVAWLDSGINAKFYRT